MYKLTPEEEEEKLTQLRQQDDAARKMRELSSNLGKRRRYYLEERNRKIYELRSQGLTFHAIGQLYGISVERVRQVYYMFVWKTRRGELD
jgi:DNA-directed RNA polymerase sigma subunit (sigma70/sigma32)